MRESPTGRWARIRRTSAAAAWEWVRRRGLLSNGRFVLRGRGFLSAEDLHEVADWIVELVDAPLLERNDRIVRDRNMLRTDLGAAFRDVAVADSVRLLQLRYAIRRIQRMHLQGCRIDQIPRSYKLLVLVMVAEDVTDVLTQEALDALPKFLHPVDVGLLDTPRAVRRVRRSRRKPGDLFFDAIVPRYIGHQIAHMGKGPHRLDPDRFIRGGRHHAP